MTHYSQLRSHFMNRITIVLITCMLSLAGFQEVQAQRRGGGGGGGRGGGGGFHGGGGAVNRPAQVSRPQVSRPQVSRPTSAPHMNRPSAPVQNRPQMNRPSNNLPSMPSRPVQRPSNPAQVARPNLPNTGNRPTTLPGKPNTSLPGVGGNRPGGGNGLPGGVTRPGTGNNLPGGVNRPGTGNNLPGGVNRPGGSGNIGGGVARPGGDRPGGINRPGGGGMTRPNPGDLGDFLGMDKPLRPGNGGNRPGIGDNRPGMGNNRPGGIGDNRPGIGDNRPGIGNNRPGGIGDNRPGIGGDIRPGGGGSGERWPNNKRPDWANNRPIINKPINIGNQINTNINRRPTWNNINNNQINVINNRWNGVVTRPGSPLNNWGVNNPGRVGYWHGWAHGVQSGWRYNNYHNNWFGASWWGSHRFPYCGWNYAHALPYYPYNYWWRRPAWTSFATFFTWGAANAAFSQPVYYDYGTGGNVVYQDNSVYIGGQQVASAPEFAESAASLATVEPPANEEEAVKSEWMPLGTFALSTGEKDTDPSRILQLAVNKEGIIAGTLFNHETDESQGIQGKVDKDTQRVAFRIGEKDHIVAETGLYNLTQEEAPLLVHFGKDKQENYLLVRLENKDEDGDKKPATTENKDGVKP